MFRDSHKHLIEGGALCVVGNRHLGYHVLLKKLFGNCETINSDSKFVVLRARKTSPSNG
jgi:16S rRNA (guanine1207-N2)-methyltransferase